MSNRKLTDKQKRFCVEYMKDLNATQAAIRAGYSAKTAGSIGEENLKKPEIAKRVAQLQSDIADRNNIEIDDIIKSDANIVYNNWLSLHHFDGYIARAKDTSELTEEQKSIIVGIQVVNNQTQYVVKDQDRAKERLMKHLGGYERDNDQKSSSINVSVPDYSKLSLEELKTLLELEEKASGKTNKDS